VYKRQLLFSWTCDLAAVAALPEGGLLQGPAFPKLVAVQCQLLARVAQGNKNKIRAGCVAKANAIVRAGRTSAVMRQQKRAWQS